jgi:hypothetical protein
LSFAAFWAATIPMAPLSALWDAMMSVVCWAVVLVSMWPQTMFPASPEFPIFVDAIFCCSLAALALVAAAEADWKSWRAVVLSMPAEPVFVRPQYTTSRSFVSFGSRVGM